MIQSASCQKLRNELIAIRAGLEELAQLLSSDCQAAASEQHCYRVEEHAELDFFSQIVRPDELPEDEDLLRQVLLLITDLGYASTIVLQHKLEISYRQAASIITELERAGLIDSAHGFRPHKVLPAAYSVLERLEKECPAVELVR